MKERAFKLYREIRRLHRKLPQELRSLGNIYVRDEFRRHQSVPLNVASAFLSEWEEYKNELLKQLQHQRIQGKKLNNLDDLTDQQIGQLKALKDEIKETP